VDGGIAQSMKFGVRASWSPIKGSRITPLSSEPSAVEAAGSPGHPPVIVGNSIRLASEVESGDALG
jgi:hypothetical protein